MAIDHLQFVASTRKHAARSGFASRLRCLSFPRALFGLGLGCKLDGGALLPVSDDFQIESAHESRVQSKLLRGR